MRARHGPRDEHTRRTFGSPSETCRRLRSGGFQPAMLLPCLCFCAVIPSAVEGSAFSVVIDSRRHSERSEKSLFVLNTLAEETSQEGRTKKKARLSAGSFQSDFAIRLEGGNVRCLQALGALGHFELNRLSVIQRLVAVGLNRGKVDENVLAGLALDESESLAGIEPLYCSLFSQLCFSLLF